MYTTSTPVGQRLFARKSRPCKPTSSCELRQYYTPGAVQTAKYYIHTGCRPNCQVLYTHRVPSILPSIIVVGHCPAVRYLNSIYLSTLHCMVHEQYNYPNCLRLRQLLTRTPGCIRRSPASALLHGTFRQASSLPDPP